MIRKFLILVILLSGILQSAYSQSKTNYANDWKKVAELEAKGLTASALNIANQVYLNATRDKNTPQQIKAAMYQMKFRNLIEEDNLVKNIYYLDTLISRSVSPAKNIMLSMQAELLNNYKLTNRYKLYGQTQQVSDATPDIETWSLAKFNSVIKSKYLSSLNNESLLRQTNIEKFADIIQKGNSRNLRPYLYDLLAHRALDYFMNAENDLTSPVYKFILNDPALFSGAERFSNYKFISQDSTSNYFHATKILQSLLQFHSAQPNKDAYIDADLKRLEFVYQHGVFSAKDSLYESALISLENRHKGNPIIARAIYQRAQLYFTQGSNYHYKTNPSVQFQIKKARQLLESVISDYPKSEGALMARNLLNQISVPELNMSSESVNIPGMAFKTLVSYKNIDKIYFRIYKTERQEYESINFMEDREGWKRIFSKNIIQQFVQLLPNPGDMQNHSAEIKIDALTPGVYYIIASRNENFGTASNIMVRQLIYVSSISYIINSNRQLYLLDRDKGSPLHSATVQVWESSYDYNSRKYIDRKKEKYQANQNGMVQLSKPDSRSIEEFYEISYKNEIFTRKDAGHHRYYNDYVAPAKKSAFLFTDRTLYRPGQQLHFKGIVILTDSATKSSSAVVNQKSRIILFDANGQKIAYRDLVTNQYGSYASAFDLPSGLLNGRFFLQDSMTNSTVHFNIEEYKRPAFSVEILKPTGSYRVNDMIVVNGTAKAYAGNAIDGGTVTYRVVRKVRYPIWFYNYSYKIWPPYGNQEEMEIVNGTTKTDANGSFRIEFKAIPEAGTDKKFQPVFNYEVIADITDMGGETRTGKTIIPVSYQAIQISIESEDEVNRDSLNSVKIKTSNINGIHERSTVNLRLEKLKHPGKIFRKRYWPVPDQFVMSRDEFYKSFPHDAYAEEDLPQNWPVEKTVLEQTDTSRASGEWKFAPFAGETGWYKITVTGKDKYGEPVKAEKFIQLISAANIPLTGNLSVYADKNIGSPGEKINVKFISGNNPVWLINTIEKINGPVQTTIDSINSLGTKDYHFEISESDRGGINIKYNYVLHNRYYTGNKTIAIPWTNKDLKISYETFRDNILPGSNEKWKIKISGYQAEKIAAEALISMYDASLDQFKPHSWGRLNSIWPVIGSKISWSSPGFESMGAETRSYYDYAYVEIPERTYDALLNIGWSQMYYGGYRTEMLASAPPKVALGRESSGKVAADAVQTQNATVRLRGTDQTMEKDEEGKKQDSPVEEPAFNNNLIRKNFNETAFFFPALNTDAEGNIEFSFTIPEALTQWKLMILAHTADLKSGYSEKNIVTQKPMMVQPNAPRFLREGDDIELPAKIVNMTNKEIVGTAQLELFDAATDKAVDGWFKNVFPNQYFTVEPGQSFVVRFPVSIPLAFGSALKYRIKAISKDGTFSDGEESVLPVLTNRILVTETLPLNMINTNQKTFRFDNLLKSSNSGTLNHHALTIEYSTNPAWYAVQSLPYLMEYPYECSEQQFNRFFANTLASHITGSIPRIKDIFNAWKIKDSSAFLSNLQKNPELKSAILQETPWVLNAQNENQQKKNIAILFDLVRVSAEKAGLIQKLKEMQTPNGGFSWFKGGRDDRYITQYILTGIGHLKKLNALSAADQAQLQPLINKSIIYLDARLVEDYKELLKHKADLKKNQLGAIQIQWLYMRSFLGNKMNNETTKAFNFYKEQSKKFWLQQPKNFQAMIAMSLNRNGSAAEATGIANSLKENAIIHPELGMYWKELTSAGYYWHQAPIENQALMIELFSEIGNQASVVNALKVWLLKNKQTNNWESTKATAEACYALLLNGEDWLAEEKPVTITVGNLKIESSSLSTEAGSGYLKSVIPGNKVQQGMGNITVSTQSKVPSWGAIYWQYFEDMDKVGYAATPLKVVKNLYIQTNSARGPVLTLVKEGTELKVGQQIKVRIEIRSDRDMEYVHLKDLRPVSMEPVNVLSQYKYQGGLGYYEMTKDASTNFFFSYLPKGSYFFEYPLFVTHSGNFSNGMASIQCMYAPEFTSHSKGSRLSVAIQ